MTKRNPQSQRLGSPREWRKPSSSESSLAAGPRVFNNEDASQESVRRSWAIALADDTYADGDDSSSEMVEAN